MTIKGVTQWKDLCCIYSIYSQSWSTQNKIIIIINKVTFIDNLTRNIVIKPEEISLKKLNL